MTDSQSSTSPVIPPELWGEIIAEVKSATYYLDDQEERMGDLKSCSLVSKEWRSYFIGHIFRSIRLPSPECGRVKWDKESKHSLSPEEKAQLEEKAIRGLEEAIQPGGIFSVTSHILPLVQDLTLDFLSSVEFLDKALPLIRQIPFTPNQIRGVSLDHVVLPGSPEFVSYLSKLLKENDESIERLSFIDVVLSPKGFPGSFDHIVNVIHNLFPPLPQLVNLHIGQVDFDHAFNDPDVSDSFEGPVALRSDSLRPHPKSITFDTLNELGFALAFQSLFRTGQYMFDCSRLEELRCTHYAFNLIPAEWPTLRRVHIRVGRKEVSRFLVYAPSEADYRRDPEIMTYLPEKVPDLTHLTALLELDYYRVNQFIRHLPDIAALPLLQVVDLHVRVVSPNWVEEDKGWDWDSLESENPVDVERDRWESLRMRLVRLDESFHTLVTKTASVSLNKVSVALKIKGTPLYSPNLAETCFPLMLHTEFFTVEVI